MVETELLAADLEGAERRLERVDQAGAVGRGKEAIAERDWLEAVVDALGVGASGRARCRRSDAAPTRRDQPRRR